MNTVYKVFSSIVQKRVNHFAEIIIDEYQCGFRKGRGTTDQIFTIRQIMEKCYKYNIDLHILFVDYKQAFDNVNWNQLFRVLVNDGMPNKLIKIIQLCKLDSQCKVYIAGKTSDPF